MPESKANKTRDFPEAVEEVNPPEGPSAADVKNAFLTKIKERVDKLSEAHAKEVNIATRYDIRLVTEELISLFNELVNLKI